ncbi:MFS transporter [Actinomadura madurae]|uniref:MFS transporter n=1 Tax=Actinomadura madurae TaxID=1993 RepID=UPI002026FC73|nr:MFS transporter [Actinomadura madurae]URN08878.1 MFS transporter [Actinomadura madurae]
MTLSFDLRRVQRRTLILLMVSQVVGSIAVALTFAVSGILAAELAGSPGAAGLAQATLILGAGAASYLLATLMNRKGRRGGLAAGYLIGAIGAGMCVVAATTESFALLIAGMGALGASSASTNGCRYAVTDLAPEGRRATTLSMVVWVATVGAVVGPLMVGPAQAVSTRLGLHPLAGPLLVDMTGALIAALVIFSLLRPDPLIVARTLGRPAGHRAERHQARPRRHASPLGPGIAALMLANAAMVAVMVMTPLEMHHQGAAHTAIGAALSAHFLGMYAFAPLSGALSDRAGVPTALVVGGAVLLFSLVVLIGWFGQSPFTHGLGLFLVGLGWSVCTVAASSHIAACSMGDTRVQGAADTAMTVMAAAAVAVAGPLMALWGFNGLLAMAAVLSIGILLAAHRIRPSQGITRGAGGLDRENTASPAAPRSHPVSPDLGLSVPATGGHPTTTESDVP